jgi:hypothetical protein
MFNQQIDDFITMSQRIIALLRDLIIGVIAVLTAVIVYYGGNPTQLNALDWAKLIGAASLIVLGPIVAFIALKILIGFLINLTTFALSVYLPGNKSPKGMFAWVWLNIFRFSKRKYVLYARLAHKTVARKHPQLYKRIVYTLKLMDKYNEYQRRINPYLVAFSILIISLNVFYRTIKSYIP